MRMSNYNYTNNLKMWTKASGNKRDMIPGKTDFGFQKLGQWLLFCKEHGDIEGMQRDLLEC